MTDGCERVNVSLSSPHPTSRGWAIDRSSVRSALRNNELGSGGPLGVRRGARCVGDSSESINQTTLGNGYLGSCIDEERSEMRYLV